MQQTGENEAAPHVSALLVSRNNSVALRSSLAALEASRERERLEIIVVDNGSTDGCERMDTEFPAVQVLRLPRHFGMVKALNIAMRSAAGEFLFLLEPGIVPSPDTVASLAAHLDAAPDAVALCPLVKSPGGDVLSRMRGLPSPTQLYRAWRDGDLGGWEVPPVGGGPIAVDYITPPVFMVRSYFLRGLRYVDERYGQYGWDLEICTQIRRVSKKIYLLPQVSVNSGTEAGTTQCSNAARGLLSADQAIGSAVWTGKHLGWAQGLKFRLGVTLVSLGRALLSLLRFRDTGYHFAVFNALFSGQKLDGSQSTI